MSERRFPIQRGGTVDWVAAEQAYAAYAKSFGREQSLDRLAERGGFGIYEFCRLYRDGAWRRDVLSGEQTAELVLSVARELGDRWQL